MLKKKSIYHTSIISRSALNRIETWTYYHAVYLTSVMYPVGSGYVTPSDLHDITNKANRVFLPKLGYNRNTAKAIVFGPSDYAGIKMRHAECEQGLAQIQLFLKHWRTGGIAGKLLKISVAWAQLLSGSGKGCCWSKQ